ncbi:Signal transducer regulating beta-lactamase production, contains metallopeptidase domain [Granulicella rosea]|uniref:Signal transducer regulating beta-lactamase production, contains metallopeptidase domain n=1 Tax=Granulicella rosea TaxID=474952 RepID=A0A239EMP0_9BACT|nr:M56 family metallopeptidase [Granulicella rosea]SNS45897.1 Signal transducer regulating beta-lactamase production, contains metallopeptidase domain [Granulicella rosea]
MNLFSHTLANAFVASTWQTALLTVALGLALRLTPRASAATRYALWTAALAIFALLPFLPATQHATASAHSPALHLAPWWSTAIASLWIALSALRLVQFAVGAAHLRRIARSATPVADWPACTAAGTARTAVLCTSSDVARPSVLGFFSPRILIPTSLFARISRDELDQIVLHEMQHLRRRDDWVNLLQKLGLVFFPLNPALLWVERRLCLERELACDDGVLRVTNAPRAYASTLVNLAEQGLVRSRFSLALGAWERRSELATRVHAILRATTAGGRRPSAALATGLFAVLIGGAGVLSRAPQLVSFAEPVAATTAAVELPSAGYQPVRFDTAAEPHATVLKAVMPEPLAARKITARIRKNDFQPAGHAVHRIAARRSIPQPRLTLTSLDQTPDEQLPSAQPEPRVVFTVIQTTSFRSYAAVPTPGGWLIIQL